MEKIWTGRASNDLKVLDLVAFMTSVAGECEGLGGKSVVGERRMVPMEVEK